MHRRTSVRPDTSAPRNIFPLCTRPLWLQRAIHPPHSAMPQSRAALHLLSPFSPSPSFGLSLTRVSAGTNRAPHCHSCLAPSSTQTDHDASSFNSCSVSPSSSPTPAPLGCLASAVPADGRWAHVLGHLRPSPDEPRALTSATGAGGAHASPLAAGSHPDGRNQPAQAPPFHR